MKTSTSPRFSSRRHQQGVGLIEVLIAVLVVSIGFLGVAALQVYTLSTNNSAMARSMTTVASYSILDAMREVASGHTSIVIAHRLSTVVDADKIVVLEQGQVVEQGSHNELLQRQGRYAQLWALQQQEE